MITSRTAIFVRSGLPMEIVEVPVPPLRSHEILVRVEMVTLCRSDLATYFGKRIEPSPTILGHEVVGRIADFGSEAARIDLRGGSLHVGDRITWGIFASDPHSDMAQRGMPQKGEGLVKYGHEQLAANHTLHGGLAQYMILRRHTPVIKIDENVPVQVAAIVNCAVATVAGAFRTAGPVHGKKILISGAGMLGLMACAMARSLGASHVGAMDIDSGRLEIARRFGADGTVLVPRDGSGAQSIELPGIDSVDAVIETSGAAWSMERTIEKLGIGGVAVWIGAVHPDRFVSLNAERIVRKLITIRGLHNYNTDDFRAAVEFIERHHGELPVRELVDDPFGLDQIDQAFEHAKDCNPFRVGIHL